MVDVKKKINFFLSQAHPDHGCRTLKKLTCEEEVLCTNHTINTWYNHTWAAENVINLRSWIDKNLTNHVQDEADCTYQHSFAFSQPFSFFAKLILKNLWINFVTITEILFKKKIKKNHLFIRAFFVLLFSTPIFIIIFFFD